MTDSLKDRYPFLDEVDQDLELVTQAADLEALESLRLRWSR